MPFPLLPPIKNNKYICMDLGTSKTKVSKKFTFLSVFSCITTFLL